MENISPGAVNEEPSSSSESVKKNPVTKTEKKSYQLFIYNIEPFPITTSPWIASVSFLFQIPLVIHMLDFYNDNSKRVFKLSNEQANFQIVSQLIVDGIQSISYVINTILSVLSILSFFINKYENQEGYKYILGWIGNKIFPILRYLIDINLAVSAIFAIKSPYISVLFIVAAVLNLLISFFCQNYTLRKDYLCCKSMLYMMIWKISFIILYATNFIGYYVLQAETTTVFIIILLLEFIITIVLFACYFVFGFLIYRHTSTQISLLFILNLVCSVALGNLYDALAVLITGKFIQNRSIEISACFSVFLAFMMYSIWTNIKKKGTEIGNERCTKMVYFFFSKLENSSQNINDDCEIRGIIKYHLTKPCRNPNCFINMYHNKYYDSKKNKFCFPQKLNQGKTSFVKFISKCIYQQELEKVDWIQTNLLLQYIQFYFMKLKNLFKVCILLRSIENKFLTPFQKLRLNRLRRVMIQQNRKLNKQLYNGNLDLQNLIVAQNKFGQIEQQIKEVLKNNIQFWKYLENYSINLSTMIKIVRPSFGLIDKINTNWKSIAKYFDLQKIWKFIFVCYTLYLRNEKLKPQLVEQFGQSVHEDELFASESLILDKTTQTNKLYVSKMIFEHDVSCVHINHEHEKAIIKSISQYFQRMFGFEKNEIIESPLDVLMVPSFQKFHKHKFLKWVGDGMSNKQTNYYTKKIFPLSKRGFIFSAFKFYKQFLTFNGDLQYVGMFKKNKEDQYAIILNENFQIEAMTQLLCQKWQISYHQYQQLIGVNLLILAPGLIQLTKFNEERISTQNFHSFNESLNKNAHDHSQRSKNTKKYKKQFSKNNLTVTIPKAFTQIKQYYKQSLNEQTLTNRVSNACRILKQNPSRTFKIQIEVKTINTEHNQYVEVYIREIEPVILKHNDRLASESYYDKRSVQSYSNSIKEQEISRFFQNSHSSQNISLALSDNIFIKDQNNQPVQMITYVSSISVYIRILFIIFFGLLLGNLLYEYQNYNQYQQSSLKMSSIVQVQLKMVALSNQYYSKILNLFEAKINSEQITKQLRQIRQKNVQYKKSLLDYDINPRKAINLTQNGTAMEFDQIDIIDKLFQNIIEITYSQKGNPSIQSRAFQSFITVSIPPIQQLTHSIMVNIGNTFNQFYNIIETKNYIYVAVGLLLLVAGFLLVLSRVIKVSLSFVNLMQIFTQLNQKDVKKISRYSGILEQLFSHIYKRYQLLKQKQKQSFKLEQMQGFNKKNFENGDNGSSSLKGTAFGQTDQIINEQNHDNANLNKKIKKVESGKQLENLKMRSIVYISVFFLLYGLASFGLILYTSIVGKQIIGFKDTGYSVFQYYSSINIYFLAMKNRILLKEKFDISIFDKYIQKMAEMKKYKAESGTGSLFEKYYNIQNEVIFGNICQIYPEVISKYGYTTDDCKSIAQNNLNHGIQTYIFYMFNIVDFFLKSSNYTLDKAILDDAQIGLQITNIYLDFLLQKWTQSISATINYLQINIIIISCTLLVFQAVIYIFLVEVMIIGNLKEKYDFFKKIYNNMMPDFIVTKQKIIKAKLEVQGFISK